MILTISQLKNRAEGVTLKLRLLNHQHINWCSHSPFCPEEWKCALFITCTYFVEKDDWQILWRLLRCGEGAAAENTVRGKWHFLYRGQRDRGQTPHSGFIPLFEHVPSKCRKRKIRRRATIQILSMIFEKLKRGLNNSSSLFINFCVILSERKWNERRWDQGISSSYVTWKCTPGNGINIILMGSFIVYCYMKL